MRYNCIPSCNIWHDASWSFLLSRQPNDVYVALINWLHELVKLYNVYAFSVYVYQINGGFWIQINKRTRIKSHNKMKLATKDAHWIHLIWAREKRSAIVLISGFVVTSIPSNLNSVFFSFLYNIVGLSMCVVFYKISSLCETDIKTRVLQHYFLTLIMY